MVIFALSLMFLPSFMLLCATEGVEFDEIAARQATKGVSVTSACYHRPDLQQLATMPHADYKKSEKSMAIEVGENIDWLFFTRGQMGFQDILTVFIKKDLHWGDEYHSFALLHYVCQGRTVRASLTSRKVGDHYQIMCKGDVSCQYDFQASTEQTMCQCGIASSITLTEYPRVLSQFSGVTVCFPDVVNTFLTLKITQDDLSVVALETFGRYAGEHKIYLSDVTHRGWNPAPFNGFKLFVAEKGNPDAEVNAEFLEKTLYVSVHVPQKKKMAVALWAPRKVEWAQQEVELLSCSYSLENPCFMQTQFVLLAKRSGRSSKRYHLVCRRDDFLEVKLFTLKRQEKVVTWAAQNVSATLNDDIKHTGYAACDIMLPEGTLLSAVIMDDGVFVRRASYNLYSACPDKIYGFCISFCKEEAKA